MLEVEVARFVLYEGNVAVFEGWYPSYEEVEVKRTPGATYLRFACDRRYVGHIIDALNEGEFPVVSVPDWAVLETVIA